VSQEILLVEDSPAQAAVYKAYLESEGYTVHLVVSGEQALATLQVVRPAVLLLDLELPGMSGLELLARIRKGPYAFPVIVITGHGTAENATEALALGAADFLSKPFDRSRLKVTVGNVLRQHQLAGMVDTLKEKFTRDRFQSFVGSSAPMQTVYRIIESAAPSRASVFITGESGTGKELCAEAIHRESPRREGPFVAVNCAALPRDLIESEIFGHVRGAFTGAVRERAGAAAKADGGTLFLDEIGEMDSDLQAKLLRFVQSGEFHRVGSSDLSKVDVRIVCATNRDPLKMILEGRFREDLYYRLYVIPIHLPPLRERGEDVLTVARQFLRTYADEEGKAFSALAPATEQLLRDYPWPGNVRELQNVLRNAVALNHGTVLQPDMLPEAVRSRHIAPTAAASAASLRTSTLENAEPVDSLVQQQPGAIEALWKMEKRAIETAIERCGGNILQAAAALEISPSTIYRKRQGWYTQLQAKQS